MLRHASSRRWGVTPKAAKGAKPRTKHKRMHVMTLCKDEHSNIISWVVMLLLLLLTFPLSVHFTDIHDCQNGATSHYSYWAGRKLLCGGGGATRRPIFPTPTPLLGRCDGRGGSGRGCPTCRAGGGGVNPASMAQNDTHVALIILTTQMWGGGDYWWEKLFRAKICVPAPSAPTSVLTQNKGPNTEPHFSNPPPPPPLFRRASMSPPPPPEQSNFQVALRSCVRMCPNKLRAKGSKEQILVCCGMLQTPHQQTCFLCCGVLRHAACFNRWCLFTEAAKNTVIAKCLRACQVSLDQGVEILSLWHGSPKDGLVWKN